MGSEHYEVSYIGFRFHSEMLESVIKPQLDEEFNRKFTLTGHLMVTKREFKPIYTRNNLANADLFLYQVFNGIKLEKLNSGEMWFPMLYLYSDDNKIFWSKLKSKRFCRKIMAVFGITTIDALKERISKCKYDINYRYTGSLKSAIVILNCVEFDEIATIP